MCIRDRFGAAFIIDKIQAESPCTQTLGYNGIKGTSLNPNYSNAITRITVDTCSGGSRFIRVDSGIISSINFTARVWYAGEERPYNMQYNRNEGLYQAVYDGSVGVQKR